MPQLYLGFNVADSMFDGDAIVSREEISPERFKEIMATEELVSCLNLSHPATIQVLHARYGIEVPLLEFPPKITLEIGDRILIISLRGLQRKTTKYRYEHSEVSGATFCFSIWTRHR